MINGFEYRDNLPKCPERSDRWLSPSNYECERDDECEEYGEDDDGDESSDDGDEDEPSDDSDDSRATKTATLAMMSLAKIATKSYSIRNF